MTELSGRRETVENGSLDFHDLFNPDKRDLIGASEGEGEFDSIKFPGSNEVDGAINRFEVTRVGSVARPFIRPLEVKPGGRIPQKRFHTRPSRTGGPHTI